jgi:undecaprenyl-diphosphatase
MRINKKNLLILGIIIFCIFIFFSYLVHKNLFVQFDFNTTVRLQDHISRKFDQPFSFLSDIGRFEIIGLFLVILLIIRRKLNGFLIVLSFCVFHLFEIYGKTFVRHSPPPHFMLRTHELFNFPTYYVSTANSYPSGHAARALFITTILFFIIRNKKIYNTQKMIIYGLLSLYDLLMLTSRIYLGEHWMSDIIGGSLLGLSFGILSGILLI